MKHAFYIFFILLFQQPLNAQWTWMSGSDLPSQAGVYGTFGVPSASNVPPARAGSSGWRDLAGNLWFFGGFKNYGQDNFNDLWKYNPSTNQWTWMKGYNYLNASEVYGVKGVANPNNTPGSREGAVSWTDQSGNFWLYGGVAQRGQTSTIYRFGDLWKFDPLINQWTWISSSGNPIYGVRGVPSSLNTPGSRSYATGCTDASGNFWLFGGNGLIGSFNDLWKYDPSTNEWTWMSGGNVSGQTGNYGTQGVAAITNIPGNRSSSPCWVDDDENFWLFGGRERVSPHPFKNDLWKYNPSSNLWTWVNGSNTSNHKGNYGIKGVPSTTSFPCASESAGFWKDTSGKFWLFSGLGLSRNDLWRYDPLTNEWTWMAGTSPSRGVYGIKGVISPSNIPGERCAYVAWADTSDKFWIFGGLGSTATSGGYLNDLWRYSLMPDVLVPACSNVNLSITSNISGPNYQWQVDTGYGFINIPSSDIHYSDNKAKTLQILNPPSSWNNFIYRCNVAGNLSNNFHLQFVNTWIGSTNGVWENPTNWSCGSLPDANTAVVINSGSISINSNVMIKKLVINPAVNMTVKPGYNLVIMD